jgi:hypothetical protein
LFDLAAIDGNVAATLESHVRRDRQIVTNTETICSGVVYSSETIARCAVAEAFLETCCSPFRHVADELARRAFEFPSLVARRFVPLAFA